jgi:hypothetical protein
MFTTNYFLKDKIIGSVNFLTVQEAENKYEENDYYNKADRFEIINSETEEIIDEGEIVDQDDIIEDMFDGEDSKEGFDWTLGD